MGLGADGFRDAGFQVEFHGVGRLSVGEAEAVRDAEHVRIHSDHGLVVEDTGHHIGGFSAHARERHQGVDVAGNLSAIFIYDLAGHRHQMCRLAVGVGDRPDQGIDLFRRGGGEPFHVGETLVEGGRRHIDPFVGTLGREDDRDDELVGRQEIELAPGKRAVRFEPGEDGLEGRIRLLRAFLHGRFRFRASGRGPGSCGRLTGCA